MHRVNCSQVGKTRSDARLYRARDRRDVKADFPSDPTAALPWLQSKVKLVSFSFAFLSRHSDNIGLRMLCRVYDTARRGRACTLRVCLST
jgi:hypothetical protein